MTTKERFRPLSAEHAKSVLRERQTSFNPTYWIKHKGDDAHYKLVAGVRTPTDFRLLYDSWLWRHVLNITGQFQDVSSILELLPGKSLTIPVSLESAQFHGTLYRLNDEPPVVLPQTMHFCDHWVPGELKQLLAKSNPCNLMLGNHVIDDLLFSLHIPDLVQRKQCYLDPHLCRANWASIGEHLAIYRDQLVSTFAKLVDNVRGPFALIIRHYPSTFALSSHDLIRINAEMSVFFSITEALSERAKCRGLFFDADRAKVPLGSKYRKSFFVLKKRA